MGQVLSYEEYYPYGSSAYRASAPNADLSLKRYRFTDKEKDDETGLYYFGVRYYMPWLGRWTAADPGGFVDGLNLYRYTRNNPVNGVDPDGRKTQPVEEPPPVEKEKPKEEDIQTIESNDSLGAAGDEIVVTAESESPQIVGIPIEIYDEKGTKLIKFQKLYKLLFHKNTVSRLFIQLMKHL